MAEQDWILKVLSGANIGAEVPLAAEDLVLGKDEDCDIVLDDVTLADRQLTLCLDDEGAVLTVLAERPMVHVGGSPVDAGAVRLNPYQLVTAGTVSFAVGPLTGDWSLIDLSSPNGRTAPESAGAETAQEAQEESPVEDEPVEAAASEDEAAQAQAPAAASTAAGSPPILAWLAATLGLILAAGALIMWLGVPGDGPSAIDPHPTDEAAIRSIAEQHGADLRIIKPTGPNIPYRVEGYVDSDSDFQRLVSDFDALNSSVTLSITVGETLLAGARSIVDEVLDGKSRVEVSLAPDSPGTLRFSGYVNEPGFLDQLTRLVATDLQGYKDATFDIETLRERALELAKMLSDADLTERVDVETTVDGIDFFAALPHESLDEVLVAVKDGFTKRYGGYPPIVWNPERDFSKRTSMPLDIKSVGFGRRPHIVTEGGFRYEVGQELDNGYRIKAITSQYILMRRGPMSAYHFLDTLRGSDA